MQKKFRDRRRIPRIKRRARVMYFYEGRRHEGLIVNFSETGLFIQTHEPPELGSEIIIPLEIDPKKKTELMGRVVWIKNNLPKNEVHQRGFGVELHAVAPEYLAFVTKMYDQLSSLNRGMSERFDVYHKVKFNSHGEFLVEYMENLSRGGMYLATEAKLEPGSVIKAQIEIDGIGEPIEIEGKVAYRLDPTQAYKVGRTQGVGVQFVNITPEAKGKLHHYIKRLEIHRLNPKRKLEEKIPLQGSLTEFLVPEILVHLYQEKFTGILLLEKNQIQKLLYFKNGQPVFVESNLNTETLGRFLVRQGKITSQDLEDSLEELAKGDAHHGEIMVKGGMIDRSSLISALIEHQEEKITNTFSWFDGTFSIEHTEDWPKTISILPLRPYEVFFAGIARWYDSSLIHAWMGLDQSTKVNLSAYDNIDFDLPEIAKKIVLHMYAPVDLKVMSDELGLKVDQLLPWIFGFVLCGWIHLDFSDEKEKSNHLRLYSKNGETSPTNKDALFVLRKWLDEDFNRLKSLNYFDLFQVKVDSSETELTKSYMKLISRYSSKEIDEVEDMGFKEKINHIISWIKLGYDTLKDAHLRQLYIAEKKSIRPNNDRLMKIESERTLLSSIREIENGNISSAVKLLKEGVEKFPHNKNLPGYLGWAIFLQNPKENYKTAVKYLEASIRTDPSDAHLHYYRGELFAYANDLKRAEQMFVKALKLFPKFVKAQAALEIVQEKLQ